MFCLSHAGVWSDVVYFRICAQRYPSRSSFNSDVLSFTIRLKNRGHPDRGFKKCISICIFFRRERCLRNKENSSHKKRCCLLQHYIVRLYLTLRTCWWGRGILFKNNRVKDTFDSGFSPIRKFCQPAQPRIGDSCSPSSPPAFVLRQTLRCRVHQQSILVR